MGRDSRKTMELKEAQRGKPVEEEEGITIKSMQSRSSRKRSTASQSMKTSVLTVSTQSRSPRKHSVASQSEMRAMTIKSTQSRSSRKRSAARQSMKTRMMTQTRGISLSNQCTPRYGMGHCRDRTWNK
jgi:hypothetical protein